MREFNNTYGEILYYYGVNGVIGFRYKNADYYYRKNFFGDIVAIHNAYGTEVATYTYDAWGKIVAFTDTSGLEIANRNPFRYRSYYYDTETGLYYVSSRYYDPEIGRFLNADSVIAGVGGSIQGYNMFAYCFNNPVNMSDPSGNWPKWVETVADWVQSKIIEPIKTWCNNRIKYNVPLYNQGDTDLCWAYSQAMIEDYNNDLKRTRKGANERAKEIAIEKFGEDNWNQGSRPTNRQQVEIASINDLHTALSTYGPLYASYGQYENGKRVAGHAVVITGVNLNTNRVYTNNPWGRRGRQKYEDFIQVFVGMREEDWELDAVFYLN